MRLKDLQQTYKRDKAVYEKALADLDAAKDDSSDDALAHLPEPGKDKDDGSRDVRGAETDRPRVDQGE